MARQPGALSQMLSHQNYVWKSHEHGNIMVFTAMGWWRMHQALKEVIRMSGVRSQRLHFCRASARDLRSHAMSWHFCPGSSGKAPPSHNVSQAPVIRELRQMLFCSQGPAQVSLPPVPTRVDGSRDVASGEQPGSLGSLYLTRQTSSPFRQRVAQKESEKIAWTLLLRAFNTL